MSFASIAEPIIKLGIPVFPLNPGHKEPVAGIRFLTEATIDPSQVAKWNGDCSNYNVAMLATQEFCFLEFDIKGGMSKAAKEMVQEVPQTRTQQSGGGFLHCIFKHTPRSLALGNRSANLPDVCKCSKQINMLCLEDSCTDRSFHHHHEWFSFRARNKYLVGAGSLHPSGNYYSVMRDVEPLPIPDWVLDFVEEHTEKPRAIPNTSEMVEVSEDFDFDDFCDFYDIGILGTKDDVWQVVEACPGVGYRHEHSRFTGFFYDGSHLGWSCFAQMCPTNGIGIGGLIKFLNKEKGESYKGVIWGEEEEDDDLLDDVEMDELDGGVHRAGGGTEA